MFPCRSGSHHLIEKISASGSHSRGGGGREENQGKTMVGGVVETQGITTRSGLVLGMTTLDMNERMLKQRGALEATMMSSDSSMNATQHSSMVCTVPCCPCTPLNHIC